MDNYVRPGDIETVTAPTGGISSGGVVVIATNKLGVAINDIAAAATGPARVRGVVRLPAETGTGKSFAQGDLLYWNASTSKLTKTSTGNSKAGICTLAKGTSTNYGEVDLNARIA